MDYGDEEETDEQSMLEDLQLAAELGKTLLERNKELETSVKQHQSVIEDQAQEIEYLTKQTAALREVNDSRLRIYEQLEVSIQELERNNQRLAVDNSADKKHIKSLSFTIESLEARCEELQRTLEETALQQEAQRKLNETSPTLNGNGSCISSSFPHEKAVQNGQHLCSSCDAEEVVQLLGQIRELKSQRAQEQRKAGDLEQQLAGALQENLTLEEKLNFMQQKEDDMKSLQEEILTLEEVRQGQLCRRCLRTVDTRGQDELSLVMDREEDDDISVVNSIISDTHCSTVLQNNEEEEHHDNPYRILVEKYEALLEMQRQPSACRQQAAPPNNCLSLQEELQLSGDFSSFTTKDDIESDPEPEPAEPNRSTANKKRRKPNGNNMEKPFSSGTPTDFSETETSSSGFSDETSNKGTQTEGHLLPPGSFLCSIADGDDCRFSIYDDASPIESRFRKTPEYRQLFREIFAVLKRAAEAKDEGEQLPLLEDATPVTEALKVPPATPAKEEHPANFDTHDKIPEKTESKSKSKSTPLDPPKIVTAKPEATVSDTQVTKPDNTSLSEGGENAEKSEEIKSKHTPKRDYLECLSIGMGVKKKSGSRKNSPMKNLKASVQERVARLEQLSTVGIGMSFTNRAYRRKREPRNVDHSDRCPSPSTASSTSSAKREDSQQYAAYTKPQNCDASWEVPTYPSAASQEVAKLKRLEKSYAEVLRLGPQKMNRQTGINHRK